MKALAIHGKEDIRWEDCAAPVPADGQVRLRVSYVGICGSDLHYYFYGANGDNVFAEPLRARPARRPPEGRCRRPSSCGAFCGSALPFFFRGPTGETVVGEPFTPGHEL